MTDEFLNRIMAVSTEEGQIDLLIEEMSELTKALLKYKRSKNKKNIKPINTEKLTLNICEEIADVSMMIEQMRVIFPQEFIEKYKEDKIRALETYLIAIEDTLKTF